MLATQVICNKKGFHVFRFLTSVSHFFSLQEEKKFPKDEGIYVLTEKNYDDAVKEFKYMLVYFYAPWCGHCKAFGPGKSHST